jgi:menaquinone-dependent protoporphyrinogen oxidase
MNNLQRRPRVLISAASKHESTTEIARVIGGLLAAEDMTVDIVPPAVVDSIDDYDAVILGSAVYAGRWLAPARNFAIRFVSELAARPVWLFSSGPVGNPAVRKDPPEVTRLKKDIAIRDHQMFDGKLDPETLGLAERMSLVGGRSGTRGDYRNWDTVARWAAGIAATLRLPAADLQDLQD